MYEFLISFFSIIGWQIGSFIYRILTTKYFYVPKFKCTWSFQSSKEVWKKIKDEEDWQQISWIDYYKNKYLIRKSIDVSYD